MSWKETIFTSNLEHVIIRSKIATFVLGVVVLGVGLHSQLASYWERDDFYRICDRMTVTECPPIIMERLYIWILIITLALSAVGLGLVLLGGSSIKTRHLIDTNYYRISAILLFISAVIYLTSAEKIKKIFGSRSELLYEEKIVSGVLTIVQSVLHVGVSLLLGRQSKKEGGGVI